LVRDLARNCQGKGSSDGSFILGTCTGTSNCLGISFESPIPLLPNIRFRDQCVELAMVLSSNWLTGLVNDEIRVQELGARGT
jgi:hypothetical protein